MQPVHALVQQQQEQPAAGTKAMRTQPCGGGGNGSRWPPPFAAGPPGRPVAASAQPPHPARAQGSPKGASPSVQAARACRGPQASSASARSASLRRAVLSAAAMALPRRPKACRRVGLGGGPRGEGAARLPRGRAACCWFGPTRRGCWRAAGAGGGSGLTDLGAGPPCCCSRGGNGVVERGLELWAGDPMPAGGATGTFSPH